MVDKHGRCESRVLYSDIFMHELYLCKLCGSSHGCINLAVQSSRSCWLKRHSQTLPSGSDPMEAFEADLYKLCDHIPGALCLCVHKYENTST